MILPVFNMELILAIDFGSTYTKVVAFDLKKEEVVAVVQSATTAESSVTLGLKRAFGELEKVLQVEQIKTDRFLCCSSAAGGLRMVVAGLVPELTTKAAQEACLGAGARMVASFSNGLIKEDMDRIEAIDPDILLLTGGTNGGNKDIILENARLVSGSRLNKPVILAGNRNAASEAGAVLEAGGKFSIVVENVLPRLDTLNVEPVREAIRDTFMNHIVNAKGLDQAREMIGDIIMPTPAAVLNAAVLLARGTERVEGLGELVVVDIGGATTDVHSVAEGGPKNQGIVLKGLPEPYAKRTVEGDLGLRHNAGSILKVAGEKRILDIMPGSADGRSKILDLDEAVKTLSKNASTVPAHEEDHLIDVGLAGAAVEMAMKRHCGSLEEIFLPNGKAWFQRGKDLTGTKSLIGTGGIFRYGRMPRRILEMGLFDKKVPGSLRPLSPRLLIDEKYIMYAVGLLAGVHPDSALRIMKKSLRLLESQDARITRRMQCTEQH